MEELENKDPVQSEEINKLKKDIDALLKYKTIVESLVIYPTGSLDEDFRNNYINNEENRNSRFLKYKNFPNLDFNNKKNRYFYDLNYFVFEESVGDDNDYYYKIIGWLDCNSKKREFISLENLAYE